MSKDYLALYLNEFSCRHNNREQTHSERWLKRAVANRASVRALKFVRDEEAIKAEKRDQRKAARCLQELVE